MMAPDSSIAPSQEECRTEQCHGLKEPHTATYNQVSLRLYPDSRPYNLEIAQLQKGLILLFEDNELVEEGIGFGVPVVRYSDRTFFASSADTSTCMLENNEIILIKSFIINMISRKRLFRGPFVNDGLYSLVHKSFQTAYLDHARLRGILTKAIELRRILGLNTQFVEVKPKGRVQVKYRYLPSIVEVEVDIRDLSRLGCVEILILNEQGSSFFRRYSDSDGLRLLESQIGAWERVHASEASLSGPEGTLAFTLRNLSGARLYRGWEQIKGGLSWAGLSYSLKPEVTTFAYEIDMKGVDD